MQKKRRVVVTGLGIVSPVGCSTDDFWQAISHGKSGVRKLTCFDTTYFPCKIGAEIKNYDPSKYLTPKEVRRMDRFVQFAVISATMALQDSKLEISKEDPTRIGVMVGSGIGGLHTVEAEHRQYIAYGPEKGPDRISPFLIPMLIVNMASGQISINLGLKGPNSAIATACATGNHAIGDAFKVIQRGDADMMVCGGSEAAITHMGFGGFCAIKALSTGYNDTPEKASRPFDKNRDGFVMAEGAGVIFLEEMDHAIKRNAPIYCELAGYGMSGDAYHMTAPDPQGDGGVRCIQYALRDAGIEPDQVDYINAHGTSTLYNDRIETLAIKKVFGDHAKKVAISSTKSVTGHMLGAAGGAELIASALAMKYGIIPPTINYETPDPECDLDYVPNVARQHDIKCAISNALGFGGHNATLVIKKFLG